jgi:hypothetical protein
MESGDKPVIEVIRRAKRDPHAREKLLFKATGFLALLVTCLAMIACSCQPAQGYCPPSFQIVP